MSKLRKPVSALLLCSLPALGGCNALSSVFAGPPDLTGNWQFQSVAGASTTTTPSSGVLLLGALTSQGSNVSGTFRFSNLNSSLSGCGFPLPATVTVSGSIDSSRQLTLTSASIAGSSVKMQLTIPVVLSNTAAGTIEVDGGSCAYASSQAIGVEVPNLSGAYAAVLSPSTSLPNSAMSAASGALTVTQATTPQADGQFPLSGSLAFIGTGCNTTYAVSGTASGVGVTFTSGSLLSNYLIFTGAANPATGAISTGAVEFFPSPCTSGIAATSSAYSVAFTKK